MLPVLACILLALLASQVPDPLHLGIDVVAGHYLPVSLKQIELFDVTSACFGWKVFEQLCVLAEVNCRSPCLRTIQKGYEVRVIDHSRCQVVWLVKRRQPILNLRHGRIRRL